MTASFADFPAEAFPFDIYAYPEDQADNVNPVWHRHIPGPGAVRIPGRDETGTTVRIVIKWPDGTESRS